MAFSPESILLTKPDGVEIARLKLPHRAVGYVLAGTLCAETCADWIYRQTRSSLVFWRLILSSLVLWIHSISGRSTCFPECVAVRPRIARQPTLMRLKIFLFYKVDCNEGVTTSADAEIKARSHRPYGCNYWIKINSTSGFIYETAVETLLTT